MIKTLNPEDFVCFCGKGHSHVKSTASDGSAYEPQLWFNHLKSCKFISVSSPSDFTPLKTNTSRIHRSQMQSSWLTEMFRPTIQSAARKTVNWRGLSRRRTETPSRVSKLFSIRSRKPHTEDDHLAAGIRSHTFTCKTSDLKYGSRQLGKHNVFRGQSRTSSNI